MKENKGITLISLVITIIILIILASVTVIFLLGDKGIIIKAKSTKEIQEISTAKERLELIKIPVEIDKHTVNLNDYLEELSNGNYKSLYNISNIEKTDNLNATLLMDEKYAFLITDKEDGNVEIIYQGIAGKIKLSEYSGTYTYPISGEFEILKNESNGELTVESSDTDIATVKIEGKTVTVTPQTKEGEVTITIRSKKSGKYADGKVTYKATVNKGTIKINATPYTGEYDGNPHSALTSVSTDPTGTTIKYALSPSTEFSTTMPTVTGASTYTVTIQASKEGYTTAVETKTVTVGKQVNTTGNLALSEASGTLTYPTNKTFTVTKNTSEGTLSVKSSNEDVVKASISGKTVTLVPQAISTNGAKATITVTSAATSNYEAQTTTYEATVNKGTITINATPYTGYYDGNAHNALTSVSTDPTGTTIKYALSPSTEFSTTMPTIIFSYDENSKFSNNKGFLLKAIY